MWASDLNDSEQAFGEKKNISLSESKQNLTDGNQEKNWNHHLKA